MAESRLKEDEVNESTFLRSVGAQAQAERRMSKLQQKNESAKKGAGNCKTTRV